MDISPRPPTLYPHPLLSSFSLSFFFLSLCLTAFHNIVSFFSFFITKHPARIFMSMSISPEIAIQPTCLWQRCTVLKSFHLWTRQGYEGLFHTRWVKWGQKRARLFLHFDINRKTQQRLTIYERPLFSFAWDNHNLRLRERIWILFSFFSIYRQKYWQYMWKQEKQLSGYIF